MSVCARRSLPLYLSWGIGAAGELSESKTNCKSLRAKTREPAKDGAILGDRERNKAKICMLEKKCRPCRQNAPHAE